MSKNKVHLSKLLALVLRHQGADMGLKFRSDGYVNMADLLAINEMANFTVDDIVAVTNENEKQRFKIITENNNFLIRANQGHSGKVKDMINDDELLEEIKDSSKIPLCIHGTNKKSIDIIKKEGLSRRERHAIHFASGDKSDESVISGIRKSANAFVYINVKKAMDAGIKFYRSENGVILSHGDLNLKDSDGYNGVIKPEFFDKITFE